MIAAGARNGGMCSDYHMSKLSSSSPLSTIHLSVKDDSRSHTFSHEYQYEIPSIVNFGAAKPKFGKGNCVSIIIDDDRQSHRLGYNLRDRNVSPPKVWNVNGITGRWIYQP